MSDYILIPLILVSILVLVIRIPNKIFLSISLFLIGISTFIAIYFSSILLISIVALICFIFVLLSFIFKKNDNYDFLALLKIYLIFSVVSMLIWQILYATFIYERPIIDYVKEYKDHYNFDLDSLGKSINTVKFIGDCEIGYPIIIYTKKEVLENHFSYDFNQQLSKDKKSFTLDSIKCILLIEHERIYNGLYSNGTTEGYRINSKVSAINIKRKCLIDLFEIEGGPPPNTVEYSKVAPESVFGSSTPLRLILEKYNELINQ
jgi:hypothetical protein